MPAMRKAVDADSPPVGRDVVRSTPGRPLVVIGLVGVLVSGAFVIVLHAVDPSLDPLSRPVSEYASGSSGALMDIAFVSLGIGLVAIGASALRTWRDRPRSAGTALLLAGVAVGVAALFEADPVTGADADQVTVAGIVHDVSAAVGYAGVIASSLVLRTSPRGAAGWGTRASIATGFAAALLGAFAGLVVTALGVAELVGGAQRLFGLVMIAWLVVVASWLLLDAAGRATSDGSNRVPD